MTETERPEATGESGSGGDIGRRAFLGAAGTAAVLSTLSATASARTTQTNATQTNSTMNTDDVSSYESFEVGEDRLVFGGQRVVGTDGYPTIQQAWEEATPGDTVYVHSSYDAQAAGEQFPIRLDFSQKEVTLTGGNPSGSVIDASHSDENVVEVKGPGHHDYRNVPVVQNLKLVGGHHGLRVQGAPYSTYQNVIVHDVGGHGFLIDEYYDDGGSLLGTYGASFFNCQAYAAGGDGFRANADAHPHATGYFECNAQACGGVGYRLRGSASAIVSSASQLNHGWGVGCRDGFSQTVRDTYVEGNARGEDLPVEIYADSAHGLTVASCYFNGINPRGANHEYDFVQRAVNAHDTRGLAIKDCVGRNYGEGFAALFNCRDADVHLSSNVFHGDTVAFALDPAEYDNVRTRSDGVIMPQDLTQVDGAFDGDRGYHVGSDREGFAVWRDGQWHLAETTAL